MDGADERGRLMGLKKKTSKKKPSFERPESWRYKRIHKNWRKPKGIDNKTRQKKRGWPAEPSVGYGSSRAVRGLHPSGMEEVIVFNVGDLIIIDPETQCARIGGSVGARKRGQIVEEALKREIRVLNPGRARPVKEIVKEIEEAEEEVEEPEEAVEAEEAVEVVRPEGEAEDAEKKSPKEPDEEKEEGAEH